MAVKFKIKKNRRENELQLKKKNPYIEEVYVNRTKYFIDESVYKNDRYIRNIMSRDFLSKSFSIAFLSFVKKNYVKKPSTQYKNVQLTLLEFLDTSTDYVSSGLIFMGGTIQALAWNYADNQTNSVLAVSSYPDYCWFHNVEDQYKRVAFLSFVVFGDKLTDVVSKNLLFIDFAPVHTLKWAPFNFVNNVLAVCGNDSVLRLLVINFDKIKETKANFNIIDGCEIMAELAPTDKTNQNRALVFDWLETFPFNLIVVGYSDGLLVIFDLHQRGKAIYEKKLSQFPISSVCFSKTKKACFVTMFDDCAVMLDFTDLNNIVVTQHEVRYASRSSWPISLSQPLLVENLPKVLTKGQLKILNTNNENVTEFHTMENFGQFGRFTSVDTCDFSGFGCATTDDGNTHIFNLNYNFGCEDDATKAYLTRFFSCAKNFTREKETSKRIEEYINMLQNKTDAHWETAGDIFSNPEKFEDWLRDRMSVLYEVPTEFTMPEIFYAEPRRPMNPGKRAANYIEKKGVIRQLFHHSLYMNCCAFNKNPEKMGMLATGGADGFLHLTDLSSWQKAGKF